MSFGVKGHFDELILLAESVEFSSKRRGPTTYLGQFVLEIKSYQKGREEGEGGGGHIVF